MSILIINRVYVDPILKNVAYFSNKFILWSKKNKKFLFISNYLEKY